MLSIMVILLPIMGVYTGLAWITKRRNGYYSRPLNICILVIISVYIYVCWLDFLDENEKFGYFILIIITYTQTEFPVTLPSWSFEISVLAGFCSHHSRVIITYLVLDTRVPLHWIFIRSKWHPSSQSPPPKFLIG